MKRALVLALLIAFGASGVPTRNNDDSCDIAVLPAATLLLPYFEVGYEGTITTLLTLTNASAQEQIAHVTLWTDYAYPVMSFNVYLSGYDVHSISLHDVIWRGILTPDGFNAGSGDFSIPNARLDLRSCVNQPSTIPAEALAQMMTALTTGRISGCNTAGHQHEHAVGYATVDVVRTCTTRNAEDPGYLTEDIRWDNVLLGDYQQVDVTNHYAEGGPVVHVRAVPEGGSATMRRNNPEAYAVAFPRTFYSRLLGEADARFDARQPLPSLFAARWRDLAGTDDTTYFKIWREVPQGKVPCNKYPLNDVRYEDVVVADEEENLEGIAPPVFYPFENLHLPAASRVRMQDPEFIPRPPVGAVAGWVYFNLDGDNKDAFATQNWILVSMRAENKYSIDMDAYALGNGCTPPQSRSRVSSGTGPDIGPAPNVNP